MKHVVLNATALAAWVCGWGVVLVLVLQYLKVSE